MTSSFPKALDTIYGAAETFSKFVAEATDNKFQIQVFPGGEIVPGLEAANEVGNGNVEMCHTASYYYWGKDPTYAFGTAVPFGLNSRQQNAWMYYGGGIDLMNEFYATQEPHRFPLRQYRRPDGRLVPQGNQVRCRHAGRENAHRRLWRQGHRQDWRGAAADCRRRNLRSLEKGAIDAAEWVGPYDDEKLGFYKVAPYYCYPGWWEGGAMLHTMINTAKWAELHARLSIDRQDRLPGRQRGHAGEV